MAESSNPAAEARIWPDPIEKDFILFLLEEAIKGNTLYNWPLVTIGFNNQFQKSYSSKQIHEKYKRLNSRYRAFTHLLGRPDMKYDPNTDTFIGNDMAWFNVVKVHSRCIDFRNKGLAHYPLLGQLFYVVAQTSSAQQVSEIYVDKQSSNPEEKQSTYSDTSTGKKRKAESLYTASGSLKTIESTDRLSMDKATKIVLSFSNLDAGTEFKALEKLEKLEKRLVFMTLPREKQRGWIQYAGCQQ